MAVPGAAAGGGAAAAAIQALKASGVIVTLEPEAFLGLLYRIEEPLVVTSVSRFFNRTTYRYLTAWRGLAFHTVSHEPLELGSAETITAKKLWVP